MSGLSSCARAAEVRAKRYADERREKNEALSRLLRSHQYGMGLTLRDGTVCRSAVLEPIGPGESRITVCEGKYHQVRRMMASRNMTVTYLERRQEGELTLGDLPRGSVRELTEAEICALDKME